MFLISYYAHERCFCSLKAKNPRIDCTFQCCSFEKDIYWLWIVIVTNKVIHDQIGTREKVRIIEKPG